MHGSKGLPQEAFTVFGVIGKIDNILTFYYPFGILDSIMSYQNGALYG
jgi:hypothetical protein